MDGIEWRVRKRMGLEEEEEEVKEKGGIRVGRRREQMWNWRRGKKEGEGR